jgi:methylglutaconyl-CoA hydratase
MAESLVTLKFDASIARLSLNRPDKRNALTSDLIGELSDAVKQVAASREARVLALAAEGPAFCAGMDLGEMQQRAAQNEAASLWLRDARVYRDLLVSLFELPIPTVAVVQGSALAGGLGLVLACDIVIAAESARFSLPEPRRGITAAIVTPFLIYRIGPGAAGYVLLSGRMFSAEECLRLGLCHELALDGELEHRADLLLRSVLSGSRDALRATKRHVQRSARAALDEQLEAAVALSAESRGSDDAREGLQAFLEKRDPGWMPQ